MVNIKKENLEGRIECNWCGAYNLTPQDPAARVQCFRCNLTITPREVKGKGSSSKPRSTPVAGGKDRRKSAKFSPFVEELTGFPVIGVDPGARYTGVVIRDADVPLYSATLVRPDDMSGPDWALSVVSQVRKILEDNNWWGIPMGIEGISDPKGFYRGKKASINPKDIIRAGMVVGALYATYDNVIIIPPGDNGSQHLSFYPDALKGRRPKDLPGDVQGAKTRGHEQSAYDVAGKTQKWWEKKNAQPRTPLSSEFR